MNTYFGGAVEALDINDDGYTDLLVGAPLYSRDQDEGRVYVYLNNRGGVSYRVEREHTLTVTIIRPYKNLTLSVFFFSLSFS